MFHPHDELAMNHNWHHLFSVLRPSLQAFFLLALIFVPLEMAFSVQAIPLLRKNVRQDLAFHFLNGTLAPLLLAALLGGFVAVMRPLYATGVFDWVSHLPLLFRFALPVIIGDIGAYWGHRWSHEIPILWHFTVSITRPNQLIGWSPVALILWIWCLSDFVGSLSFISLASHKHRLARKVC